MQLVNSINVTISLLISLYTGNTPNAFPKTLKDVMGLTAQQIDDLKTFYNEDFGIIARDNLKAKRTKLAEWIMY